MELIELKIETRGEVLSSNLDEFREAVRGALALVNRSPESDEEFGQAEVDVKALRSAEAVVVSAKEQALSQAEGLQKLFAALDESREEIRAARLDLEKQIGARKEAMRLELVEAAKERIDCDPSVRSRFDAMLESSIKGKRTIRSIQEGLDVAVACANKSITETKKVIDEFVSEHGVSLVQDREELETRRSDVVGVELRRRLETFLAEQERRRLASEVAKAKAETDSVKEVLTRREVAPREKEVELPEVPQTPAVDAAGELQVFRERVAAAFGAVKEARGALVHPENVRRVDVFAAAVNAAWVAFVKGGVRQ
jgi:hypothetical protein